MASAPSGSGAGQAAAPNGSSAAPVVGTLVESASQVELANAVEEEELLLVNEEQLEEERRLHEEREREAAAGQPATEAVLDDTRFNQLDQLLNQTSLYSKFLSEQMETLDGVAAAAAAANGEGDGDEDDAVVGGKRRASGKGAAAKKARGEASSSKSPTQELLPLMTGGEMRSYQLKGVQWMISLYQNGLNGILADQMGLGKTVQTIGFLSHLRSKSVLGPYLIIGPLSTLPNWVAEFQRWCPSFPVCLYHGNRQERAAIRAERFRPSSGSTVDDQFPAIVTSYEIVMADRKFLARYTFKYIVVDEGHRLKNFDCKLLRELKTIPSANKLLLSGTPLQNSLPELWSLLHFLLPDVFSSLEQFQSWFDFSGIVSSAPDGAGDEHAKRIADEEHRNKVVSKLHAILRPFLLRRLKSDVESNLPRKKEILLWAEMAPPQVEFNTALVNRTCDELLRKIATDGGAQTSGVSLNNVLMQLRKNCNHPDLITGGLDGSIHFPSADELVAACGKMRLLERLLTRLRAKGHKVLIFSQMTRMLDLIAHYCDERGLHCCRIDGSVHWQERRDQIANFNDLTNDAFVFLLSTRAGGLGLNLTAADTVIIYDSDWNPHQDMQAMDRVHRIGQTKPVHVYRLATAHSVEGKMLKRAGSKLMLERLVITHGNFATESVGGAGAGGSAGAGPASKGGAGLSAQELIQLLRGEAAGDDSLPQSGVISDADLAAVMDRSDLEGVTPKGKAPLPSRGVGFEVVEDKSGKGLLSTVE